jgi:prolyl oligopeptidase
MKKTLTLLAVTAITGSLISACSDPSITSSQANAISLQDYPVTQKKPFSDTYFGTEVIDPYRWLEDDRSDETGAWVKAQNQVTQAYLKQLPGRDRLRERLTRLMDYERESAPFIEGDYTYFYRNDGLQNQSVVYRIKNGSTEEEIFLDPNTFSADGTVSMSSLSFSEDGSMAAYQLSEGGSDWRTIRIIETDTKEPVDEVIRNVKFSGISWRGNEGIYFSRYDQPDGSELSAKTDHHKLYYHKVGTPTAQDSLVFGAGADQKYRYVSGSVSEDNRFLAIYAANTTSGNELYLQDLSSDAQTLITVLDHEGSDTSLVHTEGDTLFFQTNLDAPNTKLARATLAKPTPDAWIDLIPETDNVLDLSTGGGYFFAHYMVDAISQITQYNTAGETVRTIELPGPGTASGLSGKVDADTLYYTFTNYKTPSTLYSLAPNSGESAVYRASKAKFVSDDYESKQVFYTSKDGTRVPMIITHKKGIALNGENPTMLYGYGGFNISLTPSFSTTIAAWLEEGGIYAVANMRGGGEYGKAWHLAGTKMQKQNVFDDFIAAGNYLVDQGYTNHSKLAIRGGSNGGLLVGAVMTQQPDFAAVALPAVGVMDMLRYHTFTAGAGWAYDYGTADDSVEMFEYLRAYSPVHNVRAGVHYPATLVTTADHDDRVVPAHSFKFAAHLQDKQAGEAPVLIRIETDAGHGAGTPTSKIIDQYVDIFAFTLYHLGQK